MPRADLAKLYSCIAKNPAHLLNPFVQRPLYVNSLGFKEINRLPVTHTGGLFEIVYRLKAHAKALVSKTTQIINLGISRRQLDHLAVIVYGLLKVAYCFVCDPSIQIGPLVRGVEVNRLGKCPKGSIAVIHSM